MLRSLVPGAFNPTRETGADVSATSRTSSGYDVQAGGPVRTAGGHVRQPLAVGPARQPLGKASGRGRASGTRVPPGRTAITSAPAAPSRPVGRTSGAMAQRPSGVAFATSPRLGVEDWRAKLEQVRRETREMKSESSRMKWEMHREEETLARAERKTDQKELTTWRQKQTKETQTYNAQRKQAQLLTELKESREYQETKRANKQVVKDEEIHQTKEDYGETKENAEWQIQTKKEEILAERQFILEENLLSLRTAAEHKEIESEREKREKDQEFLVQQEQDMQRQMAEARAERERALQNLDVIRSGHSNPLPARTMHHPARPRNRADQSQPGY